ncbi:hypothetical protein PHSY_000737 [Pseudozyma hubeiensis SY62]|uniref:Uncharacterized protein n=1 Tax=Pseudozyma hubeiensis (strain SY62) TaxID=1305764 RepID=R9NX65_PSEHS|nr:hypothetical protein PHSY_000737 [Pseudozyma hubeiensis SY62]GAC93174.1 hypothetical protein PHSY_000737 [Pseudozyma hubeiensis SY62]
MSATPEPAPAPTRNERKACWSHRDSYFACLTQKGVTIPPGTDMSDGRGPIGKAAKAEQERLERDKKQSVDEARKQDPCLAERQGGLLQQEKSARGTSEDDVRAIRIARAQALNGDRLFAVSPKLEHTLRSFAITTRPTRNRPFRYRSDDVPPFFRRIICITSYAPNLQLSRGFWTHSPAEELRRIADFAFPFMAAHEPRRISHNAYLPPQRP